MTFTLELTLEEEKLVREAQNRGIDVEVQLRKALSDLSSEEIHETPEVWSKRFHAWIESHRGMDLPSLSDKDISRESIYGERG
ncbi:MAG: hypothetical protein H7308_04575 [Chthonomonadaceae bacterium]|nr:hypothetical protein [Chthonomonadaceae bacterium]